MLVQTTPPAKEPISLAQARLHLRMTEDDTNAEDPLIELWISAARRHAEMETGLSLITQGWRQVLDGFPSVIELERGPVQSITSITYRDIAGANQAVAFSPPEGSIQRSTDLTLIADLSDSCPRVMPAFGSVWPIAVPEIGAVAVGFMAGFGNDGDKVPEGILSWMLLRIAMLHANREEIADGRLAALPNVDRLLDPYRVARA